MGGVLPGDHDAWGGGAVLSTKMNGREFVKALETQGFSIKRRSSSFVWLARADQSLMVDEDALIPQAFLETLLGKRSHPPARQSRPSSLRALGHFPRSVPKA